MPRAHRAHDAPRVVRRAGEQQRPGVGWLHELQHSWVERPTSCAQEYFVVLHIVLMGHYDEVLPGNFPTK